MRLAQTNPPSKTRRINPINAGLAFFGRRFSQALAACFLVSGLAVSADLIITNGEDVGVTIMGSIVQKEKERSVALIKTETGSVTAVKKDHVIMDKFKVTTVTEKFIEVVDKNGQEYRIFQNKFAGEIVAQTKPATSPGLAVSGDYYKEEGFERAKGKITMTGMYRDKLVKQDLAKILMQATAEPYMEGGQIVGFKMSQIDDGSIYQKAGLSDGDIVTAVNGQELNSVAGSISLLKSLKGADAIDVTIRRNGSSMDFNISVQ